jgi:hypothetical protein
MRRRAVVRISHKRLILAQSRAGMKRNSVMGKPLRRQRRGYHTGTCENHSRWTGRNIERARRKMGRIRLPREDTLGENDIRAPYAEWVR